MFFWIAVGLGSVAVMFGVVAAIGWALPPDHVASGRRNFSASPEAIWNLVNDFAASPTWRTDLLRVERQPDQDGKPVWKEIALNGDYLLLRTEYVEHPKRLERRIVNEKSPFGGKWVFDFQATGVGCDLTIVEYGEVYNPIFRFVSHFLLNQAATVEAYLTSLENKLSQ